MRRILSLIFLLPFAPAFAPAPASACSLSLGPDGFGLPGLAAGPAAVFTADHQGATVSGESGEVEATSVPFFVNGSEHTLILPDAPLVPGTYRTDRCDEEGCVATISDGLGDPGVAPDAPDITVSASTITTIHGPDCSGPTVPASRITVSTDAVAVLFAEAPFDTLEGADVLGFAFPGGGWTTEHEGEVYAAAIDSEGELSSWVGPENLAHCATVSTPTAGWATTMGLLAALLRRRRPSARPPR